jgi:hypothetical protein
VNAQQLSCSPAAETLPAGHSSKQGKRRCPSVVVLGHANLLLVFVGFMYRCLMALAKKQQQQAHLLQSIQHWISLSSTPTAETSQHFLPQGLMGGTGHKHRWLHPPQVCLCNKDTALKINLEKI